MKMLYDHILLKEVEKESKVLLPEKAQKYPEVAEVISVGPGDSYGYPALQPMSVKTGQMVYFIKDRAIKIDLKVGKRYVVKERDILGVLEKGEVK